MFEHQIAIQTLETAGYNTVNFKMLREHVVTFIGDDIELSEKILKMPFTQTVVIEAHECEEDGNRRIKYTFNKKSKKWDKDPILPLFPAIQILDFI